MKKLLKQSLALLCCLCMALALVPTASAADAKKVLFIGSDTANDSIFYLSELAHLAGQDIDVTLLESKSASLRTIAPIAIQGTAIKCYKADASTNYKLTESETKVSIPDALKGQAWDAVVLEAGITQTPIKGNYGSDLKYMTDMIEDLASSAKLYWNMTWSVESNNISSVFKSYFEQDAVNFYNTAVTCTKDYIASNKSFDGIIYTGTAIQNARATALGEKMTRNGTNLTFKQGRLIAALTVLKTLASGANLGKVTVSALDGILTDSGTPADTYVNNAENLKLVTSAVNAACSGEPKLLSGGAATRVNTNEVVYSSISVDAPQYLRFPDITVLDNGDVIVAAYENIVHTPSMNGDAIEGVGSLVFYKSTDNGKTFKKMDFVVDEAQMEKWGLCPLSDRYERLKANPNYDYTYYLDPRDPNVKSFHCDVNGDGKKENILFLTFWARAFRNSDHYSQGGIYCTYSTDGGKTWVTPQFFTVGVKRGDVMEFNDGTLLLPAYAGTTVNCCTVTFDKNGKMDCKVISSILDEKWDGKAADGAEASFISPDGEKTVYTMIRNSGVIMRSDDRGKTWKTVGNEDGLINQPGFVKLDENRVFATWATPASPREVWGKVFYTDGSWTDSKSVLIYGKKHSTDVDRDTADPSCALLKNGKVITVSYDSYYRSCIITIQDPDDAAYARIGSTPTTPTDPIPAAGIAYASKETVDLDGKPTEFDMYKLIDANGGETNFIKLRDIAYLLNGTQANFEVGYDGTISLTTKKAYTPNGSELKTPFSGNRAYKVCSTTIKVDGKVPALAGITLTDNDGGEYNYFKLRDLGAALGFNVSWSAQRGIFVETNKPYTAD